MELTNEAKKDALFKELMTLSNLIRGSLITSMNKCGKPNCKCMNGGEKHPQTVLSVSTTQSRNKMIYVGAKEKDNIANAVAAYKRAWEILEEISSINIEEFKARKALNKAKKQEI